MIDDLVITEARRRLRDAARNEQTSIALNDLLRLSEQENKRLREENERLMKDAERYRWLRELAKSNSGITRAQAFFWNCGGSRRQLDMAIDAARGAK